MKIKRPSRYVCYHNSELVCGNLAKKALGGSKTGLFYALIQDHGPLEAARWEGKQRRRLEPIGRNPALDSQLSRWQKRFWCCRALEPSCARLDLGCVSNWRDCDRVESIRGRPYPSINNVYCTLFIVLVRRLHGSIAEL